MHFVIFVAGKFLASGIPVLNVDGIFSCRFDKCETNADFTFTWNDKLIPVECKRLQSERQLLRRAIKQEIRSFGLAVVELLPLMLGPKSTRWNRS